MAHIYDLDIEDITNIDDFAHLANAIDLDNEEEIRSLAPEMKKLCNNKGWLNDFILEGLESPSTFQQDNLYSSQSYILKNIGEKAFLRFAIWAPKSFGEQLDEDNFFSYSTAHNHDFSLLTAGYLGSGYSTSIYHIDTPKDVTGFPGEKIDINFVERFTLKQGRVAFYEAGNDIHVQHEPDDLSISLNLIVAQPQMDIRQLYFDTKNQQIGGYVGNTSVKRGLFFKFAAALPTKANHQKLLSIANTNSCEISRIYAYRALAETFEDENSVKNMIKNDSSALVRSSEQLIQHGVKNMHVWG